MIIENIRKGKEKEEKNFLNFLRQLRINKEALWFIKKKIERKELLQTVFFNIYGKDDQSRIVDGKSQLRELLGNKDFKKIGEIFIRFSQISGLRIGSKDLRIDIYIPGFDAGPGCQNWWEYESVKKIER